MTTNLARHKSDLQKLLALGYAIDLVLSSELSTQPKFTAKQKKAAKSIKNLEMDYQKWYTESYALIRHLVPDRLAEFEELYKAGANRTRIERETYRIQDWLVGTRSAVNPTTSVKFFDDGSIVILLFRTQRAILHAISGRFESSLFDIRKLVQADLFDSEIDAARELAGRGFTRSGGALAGVILEKHLGEVGADHKISIQKPHPTISELNDALKNASVIDLTVWRGIQRFGDIRNLCDHNKNREPTDEEVTELINGVEKLTKTLF